MQPVALEDHLEQQFVLALETAGARAGGGHLGRTRLIERSSAVRRLGEVCSRRATLGMECLAQGLGSVARGSHRRVAISANASAAASTVRLTSASLWASEGNQASNCEGGGYTPRARRARHHAP